MNFKNVFVSACVDWFRWAFSGSMMSIDTENIPDLWNLSCRMNEKSFLLSIPCKGVLPDALKTRCSKCTAVQKEKALDVITRLYYEHPTFYTALAERYDPAGEYTKNFEDWFDEQNALKPGSSFPGPDNVVVNRPTNQLPTDDKTAPPRRMINTDTRFNVDEASTERTRIPTSWVTQRTTMTTTTRQTTTRAPLRTSTGPIRKSPTTPSRAPTYNRLVSLEILILILLTCFWPFSLLISTATAKLLDRQLFRTASQRSNHPFD